MGRLLGCSGCSFKGTDHILIQLGRGMGRLLGLHLEGPTSYPNPIRKRNGKAPWLHRFFSRAQIISSARERNGKASGLRWLFFPGHRSYPHPNRERNGKLVCTSCSCQGTDHILTQLGRRMGRLLGCIGCFFQTQRNGKASGLHRLFFHGHRSYPHPIRERNGKAPWLHRLLFHGHRSYPHPIRERNEKAPWLHRLLFPGHRSYPRPIRERNRKAPGLHLEGHRSCSPN